MHPTSFAPPSAREIARENAERRADADFVRRIAARLRRPGPVAALGGAREPIDALAGAVELWLVARGAVIVNAGDPPRSWRLAEGERSLTVTIHFLPVAFEDDVPTFFGASVIVRRGDALVCHDQLLPLLPSDDPGESGDEVGAGERPLPDLAAAARWAARLTDDLPGALDRFAERCGAPVPLPPSPVPRRHEARRGG